MLKRKKSGKKVSPANKNLRSVNVIGGISTEAILASADVPPPVMAAKSMKKNGANFFMMTLLVHGLQITFFAVDWFGTVGGVGSSNGCLALCA